MFNKMSAKAETVIFAFHKATRERAEYFFKELDMNFGQNNANL